MYSDNWLMRELDRLTTTTDSLDDRITDQERLTDDIERRMVRLEKLRSMGATALWYMLTAIILASNFVPDAVKSWIGEIGSR